MASEGKGSLGLLLSSLFHPPDREMVELLGSGRIHAFLEGRSRHWGGETALLKGFLTREPAASLLERLKDEYDRLFSDTGKERISLVESFYKPWARDPGCALSFASERGLLMGDPAVHLSAVYAQCGLETAEGYAGMPDHIVMELEFLSCLYRWAGDPEVRIFMRDHLDWVPRLKEAVERVAPHPFYLSLISVVDLFLRAEKRRLGEEIDGETRDS